MSAEGPLMLASRPILMTNGAGPAKGVLIFATYYNSNEIQKANICDESPNVY